MYRSIFAALLFGMVGALGASAAVTESFDYDNGLLHNRDGGEGFSGPWLAPKVAVAGKAALLGVDANRASRRLLDGFPLDAPIYVAATLATTRANGSAVSAPIVLRSGEGYLGYFGISRDSFSMGIGTPEKSGSGGVKRLGKHVAGAPALCVFKIERLNEREVIARLWVNPSGPEKSDASGFIIAPLARELALDRIDLRVWTKEADVRVAFRDLRIGRTWEDVTDPTGP